MVAKVMDAPVMAAAIGMAVAVAITAAVPDTVLHPQARGRAWVVVAGMATMEVAAVAVVDSLRPGRRAVI